jgi:Bifunctional DNA primase/polymerase, N-terminal
MSSIHDGPPDRSEVLALALAAADKGRAVFPVKGKKPAIKKCRKAKGLTGPALVEHARHCSGYGHGFHDATKQPQQVTALFNAAKGRATGYGIRTGEASGGLVVVDVDGPEARQEAINRGLASGHVVKTGRPDGDGYHVYLQLPEGVTLKSRDLAPGLELKAEGTYVVGPGSWHPDGGCYRLVKDGEPPPTPEWVVESGTQGVKGKAGQRNAAGGDVSPVSR